MIRVGIVGATGYVGLELIRLLLSHPQAHIQHLVSQSFQGQKIQDIYPSLQSTLCCELEGVDYDALAKDCDVVFTALPHAAAADAVVALSSAGTKVVDLSADFRYNDASIYEQWYGVAHKYPQMLKNIVYGLPEMYRQKIKTSSIVANPGCYTTSAILALVPLLQDRMVQTTNLIVDAKSGVTGAGVKPSATVHFCEVEGNLKAYAVTTHRHTSEIEQELSLAAGQEITLSFTPHLLPVKRGILSTIYANLSPGVDPQQIENAYKKAYEQAPFVTVYNKGQLPELKHVVGSNRCAIGFTYDARLHRLVIVSCLDNLIKGAAGQAIQNMNLMMGIEETQGLLSPAWYL